MNRRGEIITGLLVWWAVGFLVAGGLHLLKSHYDPDETYDILQVEQQIYYANGPY